MRGKMKPCYKVLSVCLLILVVVLVVIGVVLGQRVYVKHELTRHREVALQSKSQRQVVYADDTTATNDISLSQLNHLQETALDNQVNETRQAILRIPSIGVVQPVYRGATAYTLALGVATFYYDDAVFGQGNVVIAGHSGPYHAYAFSDLTDVPVGADAYLDDGKQQFHYKLGSGRIINDTFVETNGVVDEDEPFAPIKKGEQPKLTLFCCIYTSYGKQRYVVQGSLVNER